MVKKIPGNESDIHRIDDEFTDNMIGSAKHFLSVKRSRSGPKPTSPEKLLRVMRRKYTNDNEMQKSHAMLNALCRMPATRIYKVDNQQGKILEAREIPELSYQRLNQLDPSNTF